MKLKIASFNISCGFYLEDDSKDLFDKEKSDNIDTRFLDDIVKIINEENIDIICFQEIITTKRIDYLNKIIAKVSLKYGDSFELSPSHIINDTELGIAVLSRYPIENSIKNFFTNPNLSKTTSSGNIYYSFDKGYLLAKVNVDDRYVYVLTHHGFPFHRFNSTPEENESTFIEFDNYIKDLKPNIITGDFNSENYLNMMPYTLENYTKTINEITTIDGNKFDNILINKGLNYSSKVIKSLSDHYMVIAEIDFE